MSNKRIDIIEDLGMGILFESPPEEKKDDVKEKKEEEESKENESTRD